MDKTSEEREKESNKGDNSSTSKKVKKNNFLFFFIGLIVLFIALGILYFFKYQNINHISKNEDTSPIVEESKTLKHPPVKNPQIAYYTFYGEEAPNRSKFGMTRNGGSRVHQGVDIFALPGTEIYAVLDGKIIEIGVEEGGYGLYLYLEVDSKELMKAKKIDYVPKEYAGEYLYGQNYDFDETRIKYIRYCHLSELNIKPGDMVKAGDILGKTGVTGNADGTKAPHLHFEIAFELKGKGLENRVNPEIYLKVRNYDELTHEEKNIQKDASTREWHADKGYMVYLIENKINYNSVPKLKTATKVRKKK